MARLTDRQKLYVDEYLIDLCQVAAYVRAGGTGDPNKNATQIHNRPQVKKAIDAAMAARSRRTGINADRVIREYAKIAFVNATDVINIHDAELAGDASSDDTAAIASVKVKVISTKDSEITEREIKLCDKIKALDSISKHLGIDSGKDKAKNINGFDAYVNALRGIAEEAWPADKE